MEEKKIVTISENNIFHIHRKEIGDISHNEKVDVGVAASKLRFEKGWGKEYDADKAEFDAYVAHLFRINGAENEAKKYFDGE